MDESIAQQLLYLQVNLCFFSYFFYDGSMVRLLIFFLLFSCGVHSKADCRNSAKGVVKSMMYQLRQVDSIEDLQRVGPALKKKFVSLVDIMILAQNVDAPLSDEIEYVQSYLNNALKIELERIFKIQGCKEKMQELQREALIRLDKHHQRLKKGH